MPRLMPSVVGLGVGVVSGMLRASDAAAVATRSTLMKQYGTWWDFGLPAFVVISEMSGMGRFNSDLTDAAYFSGLGLAGERVTRSQKTGHLGNPIPQMMGGYSSAPMVAAGYGMRGGAAPAVLRQPTGTLR